MSGQYDSHRFSIYPIQWELYGATISEKRVYVLLDQGTGAEVSPALFSVTTLFHLEAYVPLSLHEFGFYEWRRLGS